MKKLVEEIYKIFNESAELKKKFVEKYARMIDEVVDKIIERVKKGGVIYVMGNGGSASDALHIVAEFMGKYYKDRKPIRAFALPTNVSFLTAVSNDYGYEKVFERQIEAFVGEKDIVIAISTSGNSENVIKGVKKAKQKGALVISFLGKGGGKMKGIADYEFIVDSYDTPRIQEVHITLGHTICYLVEKKLFGDK